MPSFTTNLGIELPDFDASTWHTQMDNAFKVLDAAIATFSAIPSMTGVWKNSILYAVGSKAVDDADGKVYNCLVQHTSSSTNSFAVDRLANPTFWEEWLATHAADTDNPHATSVGNKNLLINADFRIAQRFDPDDATLATPNDTDFVFDRWSMLMGTSGIIDVRFEHSFTILTPLRTQAAMEIQADASISGEKFGIFQVVEARNTRHVAGEVCSLSFWARTLGTEIENLRAHVLYSDSAEDSVTADPVSTWGAEGVNPTFTNWDAANVAVNIPITGVMTQYKIENISIPTTANNLGVFIHTDDTDVVSGNRLWIGNVQLELGASATDFDLVPFARAVVDCERFYRKSHDRSVAAAQNVGLLGAPTYRVATAGVTTGGVWIPFGVKMRTAPTITFFNPAAANALWRNVDDGSDSGAAAALHIGDTGFYASATQVAGDGAGELLAVHYQADAEF